LTQLSKYAMTAHEVSAARESIGIAEKRQQYFDILLSNMPFLDSTQRALGARHPRDF